MTATYQNKGKRGDKMLHLMSENQMPSVAAFTAVLSKNTRHTDGAPSALPGQCALAAAQLPGLGPRRGDAEAEAVQLRAGVRMAQGGADATMWLCPQWPGVHPVMTIGSTGDNGLSFTLTNGAAGLRFQGSDGEK